MAAAVGNRWTRHTRPAAAREIPVRYHADIFDAFEQGGTRVTQQFGGLGLGLAISKALAQMHDGDIVASSGGIGTGACFELELPTASRHAKASEFEPIATPSCLNLRILLAEDHADTRHMINYPSRSAVDLWKTDKRNGYNSQMEKASISNLKNNLSAYLRKVRAGHPIVIYDRDVPIARLERIESAGLGSDRLASLHAKGVTRLPLRHASVVAIVAGVGSALPRAARLPEAVQEDRSEDR
jgi:antitoxin (DNA-binding transcriptional repressor) of toxin-antitoxin stability system